MKTSTAVREKQTILIVDDEQEGRSVLERVLTPLGYDLAFAGTGQEALNKAVDLIPDLVLLDVMMPYMNGYEVCRRLRTDPILAEVPILLVTALSDRPSRLEGLQAGADDFISKPFDHVELQARVQSITRLNRYRRLLVERLKFERVVEQAQDGYLIIDENDAILYANTKARLYLGLPPASTDHQADRFLALAQTQYSCEPYLSWLVWPALPEGSPPRYLIRPESETSNPFWLQVTTTKLPTGSENSEIIVQLRDVTSEMALQNDMNSFHSTISHKLRTPLISMVSSLELLMDYAPRLSTDEIIEFAGIALKGVKRMKSQIEDIVQYLNRPLESTKSSFNLGQLQPTVAKLSENLDLEPVIIHNQENLNEMWIRLSQKTVELILWEILENAKKFHPTQSPQIEITLSVNGADQMILSVYDDGIHLSPEQLRQVFTPYYQGEKLFTGEVRGMGLGLATVAAVIWGIGGSCQVYNRAEKPGLVVEVSLPLMRMEPASR